jgi:protein-tyrosine phosphatase
MPVQPSSQAPQAERADLHFHILPGVDDGPQTIAESLELAELAVLDRTSTVVATPHVRDVDLDEVPGRVDELGRRLREHGLPLEVRCGGELAYDDLATVTDAQLQRIAHGPPGARWVLLEAPLPGTGAGAEAFAPAPGQLRDRGFCVLIAHPERCPSLFDDGLALLRAELAAGSVLQLNATSLIGSHGRAERARGLELARSGLAAVVASDAHRPARGPALGAGLRALLDAGIDAATARDMTDVAPRAVLEHGLAIRDHRGARRTPR